MIVRIYAPNTQKLAWSPNGTLIGYLQGLEPKFNAYMQDHLAVVPAAGGESRPLDRQARSRESPRSPSPRTRRRS